MLERKRMMRFQTRFLIPPICAAFVLVFALVSVSGLSTVAAQGSSVYKLGPGDNIRITVFGHVDLSGEFEIDGVGRLSLPLIQEVMADGMTLRQLEALITSKLKPDFLKNPKVSVDVLNYRPFYIFGEVKKPGSYAYVNGMTIVNAIAIAGGYTYRAKENDVLIIRAGDPSREKKSADHNVPVLPGDVIEVPERFF